MNYSTFSTRSLEKILGRSAADSAEQRAVQEELRQREEGRPHRADRRTPVLFTGTEWESLRQWEVPR